MRRIPPEASSSRGMIRVRLVMETLMLSTIVLKATSEPTSSCPRKAITEPTASTASWRRRKATLGVRSTR